MLAPVLMEREVARDRGGGEGGNGNTLKTTFSFPRLRPLVCPSISTLKLHRRVSHCYVGVAVVVVVRVRMVMRAVLVLVVVVVR